MDQKDYYYVTAFNIVRQFLVTCGNAKHDSILSCFNLLGYRIIGSECLGNVLVKVDVVNGLPRMEQAAKVLVTDLVLKTTWRLVINGFTFAKLSAFDY